MNAAFLITFREGLEAALIVGILFAALRAFKAQQKSFVVWLGVLVGIMLSFLFAWGFAAFTAGFEGKTEKLYEGVLMLVAAGLITHLVFWMRREGKRITKKIHQKVKENLVTGSLWGIGLLAALSVAREGIEIVIFFQALLIQSEESVSIVSGVLGILAAVFLAGIIFFSTQKVPVAKLFQGLSCFLVFIAAGLIAHGVVELQGAQVFPTFIKPLYDLAPLLSEKEGIGGFLKAGFGYDANPSLLAVGGYWLYLVLVGTRFAQR